MGNSQKNVKELKLEDTDSKKCQDLVFSESFLVGPVLGPLRGQSDKCECT